MTDNLKHDGVAVLPFIGSQAPDYKVLPRDLRKEKFENLRCLAWWQLRIAFQDDRITVPDDPKLHEQLASLTYEITKQGLVKVERKAELKKRLGTEGSSPDRADSLVMAWWGFIHGFVGSRTKKADKAAKKQLDRLFDDYAPAGRFTGYD